MTEGTVLVPGIHKSSDDLGGSVVTVCEGPATEGPVPCLKCPECGHSVVGGHREDGRCDATDDTTLRAQATCRSCGVTSPLLAGTGETFEEAELALHEALEAEGFTDGLCEACAVLRFLN